MSQGATVGIPERSGRTIRTRRVTTTAAATCATTTVRPLPMRRPEIAAHRSESPQPSAAASP